MNLKAYPACVSTVLGAIEAAGVDTAYLLAHCLRPRSTEDTNPNPDPRISVDPTAHLVCEIGRNAWKTRLSESTFANFIGFVLKSLIVQQRFYQKDPRRANVYQSLSRAARRWILLGANDPRYRDPAFCANLLTSDVLPTTSLIDPDRPMGKESKRQIEDTLLWIQRISDSELVKQSRLENFGYDLSDPTLLKYRPILHGDEISLLKPNSTFEIEGEGTKTIITQDKLARQLQIDSVFTAIQSATSLIEPAAYFFLQYITQKRISFELKALRDIELLYLLITSMEILHGFPALHCCHFGVHGHDGIIGCISDSEVTINLANRLSPGAVAAWESKPLSLPLAQECKDLLNILLERNLLAKCIGDFAPQGANLKDQHRAYIKLFIKKNMRAYNGRCISFSQVWIKAAKLSLHLPSSIVGILRGNPLPCARGEAAYLSITQPALTAHLLAIQSHFRTKAGVSAYS